MMRVVIPTNGRKGLADKVAEHFGRCAAYTFLDGKGRVVEIIDNTSEHLGGEGLPPELMKKHQADILLCKGLGSRALDLCQELGIDVYVIKAETVREIFTIWKNNKIEKAGFKDVCQEDKPG
ncbi:MAG: NifB/NifX family molybdenum-iron cluster-binding protein [Candidatus Pacebacteria bacterium]|nr:NifB/NifX family molybdenum-iron cluster-binding protein [Candidatus Paceibacterota bacterium]